MPAFPFGLGMLLSVLLGSVLLATALAVRACRQLVLSLRERAERAEADQQRRADEIRRIERTRIAREMHDVLGHRISLLGMHAGTLAFRPDAPTAEVARSAEVIRASARQAMADLREVVGVLRAEEDGAQRSPPRPQPSLADVPALLADAGRRATASTPPTCRRTCPPSRTRWAGPRSGCCRRA